MEGNRSLRNPRRRRLIFGALAMLLLAWLLPAVFRIRDSAESRRTVAALQRLPHDRMQAAVQAFARDHPPAADTVLLRELVAGGYLRADEIAGLEGRDVIVSTAADTTTSPQQILIRVRTLDGSDIVQFADGSITKTRKPE